MSEIMIVKRDGSVEPLDIKKLHRVVEFACDGVSGVSSSEVELKSQLKFYDKMTSSDIQETLIKAAEELITGTSPNYQIVAGRLSNYHLRKKVYGSNTPPSLYDQITKVAGEGFYTTELLDWYTKEEIDVLDLEIDHDKDFDLTAIGMQQLKSKYLVKNRVTGEHFETPQFMYMLIAMTLFNKEEKSKRLRFVKDYYRFISDQWISLPTPILAGCRTPQKQFSSCVLIDCDDSLESITATTRAIVKYISNKAGIGVNVGRIRSKGSPIRKGDTYHTGIVPFLKLLRSAVKSCSQGSVRGGAATFYYPIWHLEFEDLIVLKNNKGIEDNRIRDVDYGVQVNRLFYERLIEGKDITFFCPNDVPGLYDAFFDDYDKFKEIYETAERNTRLRKKKLPASEVFGMLMTERMETGRIYVLNVDNANDQGPFLPEHAPIRMSNLCAEIALPTKPMDYEGNGQIQLCTLSAINWGKVNDPKDFEKVSMIAVRALDNLLEYQSYPMDEAKSSTDEYRTLGIGITNLAYWMAKNNLTYEGSQETYDMVDEYMEAMSYYITRASIELAKERGAPSGISKTKYSKGIVPLDNAKDSLKTLTKRKPSLDWKKLKEELKEHGIRNATLMAMMPCESSSTVMSATNGIEPAIDLVAKKRSKDINCSIVAPGYPRLKNKYQTLWNLETPEGYLNIAALIQKYTDQAISVNTSYNPSNYEGGKVSMTSLMKDLLTHYKLGGKTLYYFNTNDGAEEVDVDKLNETVDNSTDVDDNTCDGGCTL